MKKSSVGLQLVGRAYAAIAKTPIPFPGGLCVKLYEIFWGNASVVWSWKA